MNPQIIAACVAVVGVVATPFLARYVSRQSAVSLLTARDVALNARDEAITKKSDDLLRSLEARYRECEDASRQLRSQLDAVQHTVSLWEQGRLVPDGYELVKKGT